MQSPFTAQFVMPADSALERPLMRDIERGVVVNISLIEEVRRYVNNELHVLEATERVSIQMSLDHLEATLTEEMRRHRIAPFHVEAAKQSLLSLLTILYRQTATEEENLNDEFTQEKNNFLTTISQQLSWHQRWFHIYTPEENKKFDFVMTILVGVYAALAILGVASLIALIAMGPQQVKNSQTGEVLLWSFGICLSITVLPASIILLLAFIARECCEPCIENHRRNIPEAAPMAPARILTNSLSSIFNQYQPRRAQQVVTHPVVLPAL